MLVQGHLRSGYKTKVLRTRGWSTMAGVGAYGWRTQGFGARPGQTGGTTQSPGTTSSTGSGSTTATTSGPAGGGIAARLAALASRPPLTTGQSSGIPASHRPGQTTAQASNTTTNQTTVVTPITCPAGTMLDYFGESCIPITGATTNAGTTVLTTTGTTTGLTPLDWVFIAAGGLLVILLAVKR